MKSDSELHIDKDFIVLFPACLYDSLLALLIVLGDAASKEMAQGYSGPTPKQQGPSQIRAHADRSQPGAQVLEQVQESFSAFMFVRQLSLRQPALGCRADYCRPLCPIYMRSLFCSSYNISQTWVANRCRGCLILDFFRRPADTSTCCRRL